MALPRSVGYLQKTFNYSKKRPMNTSLSHSLLISLLLTLAGTSHAASHNTCTSVTQPEGTYSCAGECVITDAKGNQSLIQVSGETDRIQRYPGSQHGIYQVDIEGGGGFKETEIGPLNLQTLYTATSHVSDGQYPVLENYIFQADKQCHAQKFTKVVRNPTSGQFKACVLQCEKHTGKP